MSFCFVYLVLWEFLQSEPAAKVGSMIGWTRLTVYNVQKIWNKYYYPVCIPSMWSLYTVHVHNSGKTSQSKKKNIVKDMWFTLTQHIFYWIFIISCLQSQIVYYIHILCLAYFIFYLTFIIYEWRYDGVQQWALCKSVWTLTCCRMGGNSKQCVLGLYGVQYVLVFHYGSMVVLSPGTFLKECLNYSSLSYKWR